MKTREFIIPKDGWKKLFWKYIQEVTGERSISKFFWQGIIYNLFYWFPTAVGSILRGYIYRVILGKIGKRCIIEKNVRFFAPQRIFFGDRVLIGERCFFNASHPRSEIKLKNDVHIFRDVTLRAGVTGIEGKIVIDEFTNIGIKSIIEGDVEIGKYSNIGPQVMITSERHGFNPDMPIRYQKVISKKVVIGEDVFIGGHAIVLCGVTIGDGSIIGAGAVVTRDIPSFCVAVGVPAKVIKNRAHGEISQMNITDNLNIRARKKSQ